MSMAKTICGNCGEASDVVASAWWAADEGLCAACWDSARKYAHMHVHDDDSYDPDPERCGECARDRAEQAAAFAAVQQ